MAMTNVERLRRKREAEKKRKIFCEQGENGLLLETVPIRLQGRKIFPSW